MKADLEGLLVKYSYDFSKAVNLFLKDDDNEDVAYYNMCAAHEAWKYVYAVYKEDEK
jgi:hypothetical protein